MVDAADPRWIAGADVLDHLVDGAARTGADAIEVVRDGAALLLRRNDVLVRVRPAADAAVAEREVHLAGVLAAAGVPVTELVAPDGQPLAVGSCVVTAWRWAEAPGASTPADLGHLARTLRECTADVALTVPVLDPIEAALGAVAHLPDDDPEAAFVRIHAASLAGAWADAASDDPLGRAVVHGDLHAGNVVASPSGVLLTDLELAGAGPSSYDAAPAVVAQVRYGADDADLDAFLAAFGADPRGWTGFATFTAVYELWVTAWAVGVRHQDPSWAREAARRVATLRDGAEEPWTLH
ncbi:MAG: phosphotransferase [Actinobacteria bacterium]|nr:phosphotransferase [Actinomycetota bacterium]